MVKLIGNALKRILVASQTVQLSGRRQFWGWLNEVANKVDPDRIKNVGPDQAAAEWLIRCGAGVKWSSSDRFERDYNTVVSSTGRNKICEIDGTDSTITSVGFPYLAGLTQLKKIVIKRNPYLDDPALAMLAQVKGTLNNVELYSIANITDVGVKSLVQLDNLKSVVLFDLPSVKSKEDCLRILKSNLPNTDIDWPDVKANGEGSGSKGDK